jgi:hypothetical protein
LTTRSFIEQTADALNSRMHEFRRTSLLTSSLLRSAAIALTLALTPFPALAQSSHPPLLRMTQPIVDKNFYLFSALGRSSAAQRALAADPEIQRIVAARRGAIDGAVRRCKQDVVCQLHAITWTDEEILAVSLALQQLGDTNPAVKGVIDNDVRPSVVYPLLSKLSSGQLLARAWEICAHGLNNMIAVYGEGAAPRYPEIDSISFDMKSDEAKQRVAAVVAAESTPDAASHPFYELSLQTALTLLNLNHRDEAGRFEPMEDGENKAALAAIATTAWQNYPYTVIVVPGLGPSDLQTALTEGGRQRATFAAVAYRAHKAPFILVSGGYVHPSQTRFSEAIEMKRALMTDLHIPESAIIVDPHARHTTTNMRNAVREMFRYGIPTDKPGLVVSNSGQVASIMEAQLPRSLRELGYLPFRIVGKNSDTEAIFLPLIDSLEQDPAEPLDP